MTILLVLGCFPLSCALTEQARRVNAISTHLTPIVVNALDQYQSGALNYEELYGAIPNVYSDENGKPFITTNQWLTYLATQEIEPDLSELEKPFWSITDSPMVRMGRIPIPYKR
jgi:hypothetical protein